MPEYNALLISQAFCVSRFRERCLRPGLGQPMSIWLGVFRRCVRFLSQLGGGLPRRAAGFLGIHAPHLSVRDVNEALTKA